MRTFIRALRILSIVTLFFFCWTFMPLWQIAAWAAEKKQPPQMRNETQKPQTTGERFEKALEGIREHIHKAETRSHKGEEPTDEIHAIKAKKAEIETIDTELKTEFAATEKKLKDANLPSEILERHHKFVKHYQDNLRELVGNLEQVEKAQTRAEVDRTVKKAKLHLEKTKPPRKHKPLDPNKLPHRMVKAKEKAPRLKKEEFERDFPQKKHKNLAADDKAAHSSWLIANQQLRATNQEPFHTALANKPILVAANGSLAGLLSPDPQPEKRNFSWPSAISNEPFSTSYEPSTILLAQAAPADAPTADDLSETPEVQFTLEIQALATQLNHNPVKIYEYVRNNIEFVPTYGSIQGANMCLQTQQCNAFDTASLLIALLRASNIAAHYVYGTIEVPIDKAMNWVGGFTDPRAAVSFIASGGIPVKPYASGGVITKVQMEHVWTEAWIDYIPSRGAVHKQGDTWIPMDGSYKQYKYTIGFDMTATIPFSQDAYLSQVQSQNPVHYYQNQIQTYLDANMPDTSIVDVKGYREIQTKAYDFLPSTLQYKTIAAGGEFAAVPADKKAKVMFTLSDSSTGSDVSYTATTHELAGKRITISYIPATSADDALINNYGGFLYNVPAYMLHLKPVLKVEGVISLTGETTTLGSEQSMTLQFTQPSGMNEAINKKLIAGAYYAVGMDLQGVNENVLGKRNYHMTTNVLSETAGTLGKDDLIGEHLFILATTYHLANDKIYKSAAKLFNTAVMRTLSESITSFTLSVDYIFSLPKAAMPSGINMDVAMDRVIAVAKDGNTAKEKAYMDISGLVSSYHEHDIFERIDGFSSVSAVRALQVASANGIAIQHVTLANIAQILPALQVNSEIKSDIQNAINAGKEVTIPQTNVQINDWNGIGYIVKDPLTGSGTYMISGGLAGGDSTSNQDGMQIVEINKEPLGWVKDNIDPQTRNTIATSAELDLGEQIAQAAVDLIPQYPPEKDGYNKVGTCVGVVRRAHKAAGICLDEWSGCPIKESVGWKNDIRFVEGTNGVRYLFDLANKLNINESVSKTRAPLVGDLVFFKYTNDPGIRDHVGIVISVYGAGVINFVDATKSAGVSMGGMSLSQPSDPNANKPLLNRRSTGCTSCYAGQLFDGYGTIRNVIAQPSKP